MIPGFPSAIAAARRKPYIGFTSWDSAALGTGWALSNGDLTATGTANNNKSIRAKTGKSTGKHYWEVTWVSRSNASWVARIGIANSSSNLEALLAEDANGWAYYANSGNKVNNGSSTAYGSAYTVGDVIGVALDLDNGKLWFSKNGVWQASGDPAAGTNPAYTGLSGTLMPALGHTGAVSGNDVYTINVGPSFTYSAPSGFNKPG